MNRETVIMADTASLHKNRYLEDELAELSDNVKKFSSGLSSQVVATCQRHGLMFQRPQFFGPEDLVFGILFEARHAASLATAVKRVMTEALRQGNLIDVNIRRKELENQIASHEYEIFKHQEKIDGLKFKLAELPKSEAQNA